MQGRLAGALLGELELFPDAPLDVILDIRERLKEPRILLRAALADAAQRIATADADVTEEEIVAFRRGTIDLALAEFSEQLHQLDAKPTLTRLTSDTKFNAAVGATVVACLAGVHGPVPVEHLAQALLSSEAIAAAAKEAGFRQTLRATLRSKPFWLLREAEDMVRRRF